jgi:hypothetical protein
LAAAAQPRQRQRRVVAAGQDQPQLRRQVVHQQPDQLVDRRRLDQVVVVQHQHVRIRPGGQLVDQRGHYRLERPRRRVQQCGDTLPDPGVHLVQGGGDVAPEPRRVVVAFVQRQPGDRSRAVVGPVGQQGGLAEPGRGAHQGELAGGALGQPLQQPRAGQEPGAGAGRVQLGGQQHVPLGHAGRGHAGHGRAGRGRFSHRRLARSRPSDATGSSLD